MVHYTFFLWLLWICLILCTSIPIGKKMYSYTLVVVDMQPGFETANRKRVRANCLREIRQAVEDDAHIIFLQYENYEDTHKELTENLHDKVHTKWKCTDDGSHEVEAAVRANKLPLNFKVCGINTDCCVAATVRGLQSRFPMANIRVVADACDSNWNHHGGLNSMNELKGNVTVAW